MAKVKVGLNDASDSEVIAKSRLVAERMGENASVYPSPTPALTALMSKADSIEAALLARAALLQQVQALTVRIRSEVNELKAALSDEAAYAEKASGGDPEKILLSGFDVAGIPGTPAGPMPKVEGLNATQGDGEGEIELQWTPIRIGRRSYEIEMAPESSGPWVFVKSDTRSSTKVTGLTSGKRYWFRVRALGSAGTGLPSDPVTRTAP